MLSRLVIKAVLILSIEPTLMKPGLPSLSPSPPDPGFQKPKSRHHIPDTWHETLGYQATDTEISSESLKYKTSIKSRTFEQEGLGIGRVITAVPLSDPINQRHYNEPATPFLFPYNS